MDRGCSHRIDPPLAVCFGQVSGDAFQKFVDETIANMMKKAEERKKKSKKK